MKKSSMIAAVVIVVLALAVLGFAAYTGSLGTAP